MNVLVVGGGVAGAAVVHRLLGAGPAVSGEWVWAGAGASELSSGAYDWPAPAGSSPEAKEPELVQFAQLMGWNLPPAGGRVATLGGLIRPAAAWDSALLNLASLQRSKIGVVDFGRYGQTPSGYSADWLARSYNASDWAASTQTRFVVLRRRDWLTSVERGLNPLQLAWALEQPDHPLAEQLSQACALEECQAALLPPCVGTTAASWQTLAARVGVPVGQTLSEVGGLAGYRFEHARDALGHAAKSLGWNIGSAKLQKLERTEGGFRAQFSDERIVLSPIVVLCTGGIAGGGFVQNEAGQLRPSFELVGGPFIEWGSAPRLEVASAQGFDATAEGARTLQAVGFGSLHHPPGLFVAGDAAADQARFGLVAARSALRVAERVLTFVRAGL